MGEQASFTLRPPRPRLQGRGGLLSFGTTGTPAASARVTHSLWNYRGPRRMGKGASFALGPQRPPPHGRGGFFRFGTIEAPPALARGPPSLGDHRGPAAWVRVPPSLWDHRGAHRVSARASLGRPVGAGAEPVHTRTEVRPRRDRRLGRVCLGPRTDTSGRSAMRLGGGIRLRTRPP